jgi:plastocyanin
MDQVHFGPRRINCNSQIQIGESHAKHIKDTGRGNLACACCNGSRVSAYAAETVVNQQNLKFVPDAVTIAAGDTIRFTNSDHFFHDVTVVNPDGTTEDKGLQDFHHDQVVTFAKPGVYTIKCRLHPAMTVAVTVK